MMIVENHPKVNNTYHQIKEAEKFRWGLIIFYVFFSKPTFFIYFQDDKTQYERKEKTQWNMEKDKLK